MVVKATTKYGDIYVSDKDHIGSTILKGEYFEEDIINMCLENIREDSNVLDIGANVGAFSLAFLSKKCNVHAFEPQKFLINLMQKTFEGNDNIKLYHTAVGFKTGKVNLNWADDFGEFYNGSICKNLGGMRIGIGGEEVDIIKLDDLDLHNVSVLKIDVEGYEANVIKGAKQTIIREKPFIVFESQHLPSYEIESILYFLKPLGYKCEEKVLSYLRNYICTI